MGKGLALDIGGTKIAAAVVTESGMLIGRQQIATPRGGAGQTGCRTGNTDSALPPSG